MLALAPALQHTPSDNTHRASSAPAPSTRPPRPVQRRSQLHSSTSSTGSSTSLSSTTPSATTRSSSVASQQSITQSHRNQPVAQPVPAPQPSSQTINNSRPDLSSRRNSASSLPPTKPIETAPEPPPQLDIHAYPATDLLRLLASLLTQIAATNDSLANSSSPPSTGGTSPFPSHSHSGSFSTNDSANRPPIWQTLTTASRSALSIPSSSLAFHARNIPTISLEAYLLRILKYCPTTNEVFLSLLVYFDRMSKLSSDATGKTFVIDSYNIHRLVIAGVTVASKFFSDVFYTNSRYAKVGGLPQGELNQLELQFLLLNDFRLMISTEEMQRYAEQLILFSQSQQNSDPTIAVTPMPSLPMQAMGGPSPHENHNSTGPGDTPSMRPQLAHRSSSLSSAHSQYSSADEVSEASTEYDGETDDEPTIRPTGSDNQSLYSTGSTDDREDSVRSP